MNNVTIIDTQEHFRTCLAESNKLQVAYFHTPWATKCTDFSSDLKAVENKYSDSVHFLHVDADDCALIAQEYNVTCMPTFILLKNGQRVFELTGANREKLTESIDAHV